MLPDPIKTGELSADLYMEHVRNNHEMGILALVGAVRVGLTDLVQSYPPPLDEKAEDINKAVDVLETHLLSLIDEANP